MHGCDEIGVDELPRVMQFDNLHCTESLREAKTALKDTPLRGPSGAGIYCIANQETGQIYIGSSVDLHDLQRAIVKYGLAAFIFLVVEQCTKESLLEREPYWLNWLFSLPEHLRYNFLPTAGSLLGFKHSDPWAPALREKGGLILMIHKERRHEGNQQ
ncbi:hypothetical protein BC937DRAFT_88868 [Endogone sp. FLAS-F59071]|nr:hypothetical protein BC937DRAFT_88868 [Endogone sp. FLAS-F59071]|eukprot:RUS23401.1 hypothetical protein BC937DRAFT_88868 [Endogone sp. FLAS-F59071]